MTTKAQSDAALRERARLKVVRERDELAKDPAQGNPVLILSARYDCWPTTIRCWIKGDTRPTLPQSRRILGEKP